MKGVLQYIFRITCGALFIYGAYLKAISFENFEFQIAEIGLFSLSVSSVVAYLFISLEILLGIWLVINPSRVIVRSIMVLLLVLSAYLLYLLATKGNSISCGCMGTVIYITPIQALIKNFLIIGFLIFFRTDQNSTSPIIRKYIYLILSITVAFSFCFTYYFTPIEFDMNNSYDNEQIGTIKSSDIEMNGVYFKSDSFFAKNDKYVLVLISTSCGYCKKAAARISKIKEEDNKLPFFIIINGDSTKVDSFVSEYKLSDIPKTMLYGEHFVAYAGNQLPRIYLVEGKQIKNDLSARSLSTKKLRNWFNED